MDLDRLFEEVVRESTKNWKLSDHVKEVISEKIDEWLESGRKFKSIGDLAKAIREEPRDSYGYFIMDDQSPFQVLRQVGLLWRNSKLDKYDLSPTAMRLLGKQIPKPELEYGEESWLDD